MTPFSRFSTLSYELNSWELETKANTLENLDKCLKEKKLRFEQVQQKLHEEINQIEKRHQTIDYAFPLILKYFKGLHDQFKGFEKRSLKTEKDIEDHLSQKKYFEKEYICLRKLEHKTQHRLKEFEIFKRYLEHVCEASNGAFPTKSDLLEGFTFLSKIRETMLLRIQQAKLKRKEKQDFLNEYLVNSKIEILKLCNHVEELKKRKLELDTEATNLELKLSKIQSSTLQNVLLIGNLQTAIYNLYVEACRKVNHPLKIEQHDTIGQLSFLETAVAQLKLLLRLCYSTITTPESNNAVSYMNNKI